ncbi:MAG: cyclodeaminase/cyclohydrolase family protein, partial [Anaerolineae bacterium]|nr:cyclodeaminase/cyclohydrolase family protein [Anaerolineae bacterium]
IAIRSMGLEELGPFDPDKKIIEYALATRGSGAGLTDLTVRAFADAVASEAPTPGGGSVAALAGALGAALGTMVANGSAHKRGWDERWELFSDWAVRGRVIQEELLALIDADSRAFDELMAAFRLSKATPEETAKRSATIQASTRGAIEVPLRTMRAAVRSMEVTKAMAEIGNPNAASDAAVGALCARAAVRGAYFNVRINLEGITDQGFMDEALAEAELLLGQAQALEREVLERVAGRFTN